MIAEEDIPVLDLSDEGFSTRGQEVLDARSRHWAARTPWGWAVLRHRQAGQLLRDRRLRQGSHAWPDLQGLTGSFAQFWTRSIISQEGQTHRTLRTLAMGALDQDHILALVPAFEANAEELAQDFRDGSCFVKGFSEPFAGQAISTLLALPKSEAAWIARDASALGLAMAVGAKRDEAKFNAACDRLMGLAGQLLDRAGEGQDMGFVGRLVSEAAARGGGDRQALLDLVVIAIFGGVDTTRAQLAFAMDLFVRHPDQWGLLRNDPELIPRAIDEVIRHRPTTTWATREAVEEFVHDGVRIRPGEKVHILVHPTSTDAAVGGPDRFDITAKRKIHFGFGGGAHHCLGQFVARTDMAAALRVLSRRWERIEHARPPRFLPDSGNTAPQELALAVTPAKP